ncbi:MAG: AbrB/MazE/SpoVT family DNA-binding domain-containing protein [Candidatus Pacebacteria bacterium]|nr:AbrB/MazE/SpoVT family DNA-binding domain-containing protein [Candidatus Paceibacterota bacterium]
MRRKLQNRNIRKIFKRGASYSVTLPIELVKELKWREKQKVVVKKRGDGLVIVDWEE